MADDMKTQTDQGFSGDFSSTFSKMRSGMLWIGVAMIVLGMIALALPLLSSLVVEIFVGLLLTISGLVTVTGAFSLRGTGVFMWASVAGLLTLAAGILMLFFPVQGLVALTLLVAIVLFVTGAAQVAFASWMRPAPGWIWSMLSALVSLCLGALIIVTLPEASAVVLGVLIGFDFLSTGVALVLIARSAKSSLLI